MIAIVAQNKTFLMLFRMFLDQYGYQTSVFLQNDTTLKEVADACPGLIICNYFSGFFEEQLPFVISVHETPGLSSVPILCCASHEAWPEDHHRAAAFPWLTVVEQPFYNEGLLKALRALVG